MSLLTAPLLDTRPLPGLSKERLRSLLECYLHQAVSVWTPRRSPQERFTARLLFYNNAFAQLCDASSFAGGAFEDVFPRPVVCRPETAAALNLAWSRALELVDAIHAGKVHSGTTQFLHVSKLGRLKEVELSIVAVNDEKLQLQAFVVVEEVCTTTVPPLQRGVSFSPESGLPIAQPSWGGATSASACSATFRLYRGYADWIWVESASSSSEEIPSKKPSDDFMCTSCGATETSQRRCVLPCSK